MWTRSGDNGTMDLSEMGIQSPSRASAGSKDASFNGSGRERGKPRAVMTWKVLGTFVKEWQTTELHLPRAHASHVAEQ